MTQAAGPSLNAVMVRHRTTMSDFSTVVFVVCAAISVAAHVGAAWRLASTSLGRIDPALLSRSEVARYIQRRPEEDLVALQKPRVTEDQGQDQAKPDPTEQETKSPDLADLSAALLADVRAADEPAPTPAKLELKQVEDQRPAPAPVSAAALTGIELPTSAARALAPVLAMEVKFRPGLGSDGGSGSGSGTGSGGTGSGGPGAGGASAQQLLASARLIGASNPQPLQLERPQFQERRDSAPVRDVRDAQLPIAPPKVDFDALAFSGPSRIEIPEKLDADFDYVISRYIPQDPGQGWFSQREFSDQRGFFKVEIRPRQSIKRLHTMPKDLVILIDISGSITQQWVDQVVRGVGDGLSSLNKGDRFNIVFFRDSPIFFSTEQIQPFNDETYQRALTFLKDRKSDGYTDINRALARLLVRDLETERVYNIVLISDGVPTRGTLDTVELINLITRDNALVASIYCVGVAGRQNRELLEFLAYRNKGYCVFANDQFHVASGIRDLLSRLRFPIMKDVRLSIMGIEPDDIFPSNMPNLYQGEQFTIYGRFDRPRDFTMRLAGHNGQRVLDITFTRNPGQAPDGAKEMAYEWAFWKLHHLYSEMLRRGQSESVRREIDDLRREFKLKTINY